VIAPLWYDEIMSLTRARLPFWEHMRIQVSFWEIILRAFATPELIRVPAMLATIASALLLWRLTRNVFIVMTFVILPGVWWLFIDARYYAGLTLLFVASLVMANENRRLGLFGLAGLSIYIHPIGPVYVAPALIRYYVANKITRRDPWLALVLLAIWAARIPWKFDGDSLIGSFWLKDGDPAFILREASLAIGTSPQNIAVVFLLAIFMLWAARPSWWIVGLPALPLLLMYGAGIVIRQPVMFYRTMQPALLIGAAILIGRLNRGMLVAWVLILLMQARVDYSAHSGHIEIGAEIVRARGGCYWADEFATVALSLELRDAPRCERDRAAWVITLETLANIAPVFVTDGWHYPSIQFYEMQ